MSRLVLGVQADKVLDCNHSIRDQVVQKLDLNAFENTGQERRLS